MKSITTLYFQLKVQDRFNMREEIKKEFDERIGDYEYDPYLNSGPPPLDYVD